MLYIEKGRPPSAMLRTISEIKSSPQWRQIENGDANLVRMEFDKLPKETIRENLLKEQHYLCAYCMRNIKNDGLKTTIEHISPLSRDKERALDYKNMLAVCDGGRNWRGAGKRVLCCDACKKDEIELKISPLNKQQMDKIAYNKEGFITTGDKELDEDINQKLCLNGIWKNGQFIADTSTGLVKGRRDTYLQFQRLMKKMDAQGICTSARIKKKMDEIEHAEQRLEYAGVLLYFLKKKYQTLVNRGR